MDPLALQERKFTFGKVKARQSVSAMGEGKQGYLYVCTTFSVPVDDVGYAHEAKGSRVDFADADQLNDEGRREQLAREHLAALAAELRLVSCLLSSALTPHLEVVAP